MPDQERHDLPRPRPPGLQVSVHGGAPVLRVAGDVDMSNAEYLRGMVLELAAAHSATPHIVIVDLSGVGVLSVAGMEALAAAQRAYSGTIDLRIVTPGLVQRSMQLTGLDHQLSLYPTLASAYLPRSDPFPDRRSLHSSTPPTPRADTEPLAGPPAVPAARIDDETVLLPATVHEASGMVAGQLGVDMPSARAALRGYAASQGIDLVEAADRVLDREVRLEASGDPPAHRDDGSGPRSHPTQG